MTVQTVQIMQPVRSKQSRALYAPALAANSETVHDSVVRGRQHMMLGCRCVGNGAYSCKCAKKKDNNCQTHDGLGLLRPLDTEGETRLRTLLKARTRLADELTKPRLKLDNVQDRRLDYVTLSAIDESLRRICAFDKDPVDCGTDTMKYCNWIESIHASNAHNSVQVSAEKMEEASRLCTLARELGNHGPSMQETGGKMHKDEPTVRAELRKKALDSLTQGDKLTWGTDPHYEYKSRTSVDLRSHPAVLACGSDTERADAMAACFAQVLADRRHNIVSPMLAQEMTRTLMASVGLCPDATDAPTGIPTIKQTPKYAPEQVQELLAADLRPRWRRALGMQTMTLHPVLQLTELAAPDWSRDAAEQTAKKAELESVARTGYTAKKLYEELRMAMDANTQRRNERGQLIN